MTTPTLYFLLSEVKNCFRWVVWLLWVKTLLALLLVEKSYAQASLRPNVVAEVPGLDVGPLVSVTVAEGDTARLPCRHPNHTEDSVSLVLWYLNHTTRPFLSYDARDKGSSLEDAETKGKRSIILALDTSRSKTRRRRRRRRRKRNSVNHPKARETQGKQSVEANVEQQKRMMRSLDDGDNTSKNPLESGQEGIQGIGEELGLRSRRRKSTDKMSLEGAEGKGQAGGTSLVIQDVSRQNQAEYRCRVHFRLSPTWTQRLLLTVKDVVHNVELTDATGRSLEGSGVGPFAEGDALALVCKANHGNSNVLSLAWLLDGGELDATWASAEKGVVINQLTIEALKPKHRNARLTCRLTIFDPKHPNVAANITDASILLKMFYVPESKLLVKGSRKTNDGAVGEGGGGGGGGGVEILEGSNVTFFCSVRADPPAYNITWLQNGRLVSMGGKKQRRDKNSLIIKSVTREDSGLYTCLASNSEGDGHSNAVHLKVAHPPYCSGKPQRHIVVSANTTVTLSCQMEAVPTDVVFKWKLADPPPMPIPKGVVNNPGTADISHLSNVPDNSDPATRGHMQRPLEADHLMTPNPPVGKVVPPLESTWGKPSKIPPAVPSWPPEGIEVPPLPPSWPDEEGSDDDFAPKGNLLPHKIDPSSPVKSYATVTPTAPVQVICYARNGVGRTRVPCTYVLNVVEPLGPLQGCNITTIGETKLEVKCDALAHIRTSNAFDDAAQIHHSPNVGFVRSPEASVKANLEVWTDQTLLANISNPRPEFKVEDLPPGSSLKLVLYSATAHTRSIPLNMYARTLSRTPSHITDIVPLAPTPPQPNQQSKSKKPPPDTGGIGGLGMAIAILVGGLGASLSILVSVIMLMRRRQRRRLPEEEITPDHLSVEESKEILKLNIPVIRSPSEVTHIALSCHTPPPPKVLARSNERLYRSRESLRSCGNLSLRAERLSCSRDMIADYREGKSLPGYKERTAYSRDMIADLREGKSLPRLKSRHSGSRDNMLTDLREGKSLPRFRDRASCSRENIADLRDGKSLPRYKDRSSYSRENIADLREGKSLPRYKDRSSYSRENIADPYEGKSLSRYRDRSSYSRENITDLREGKSLPRLKDRGSYSRENIADLREGKSLPRLKDRSSYSRENIVDLREGKSLPRLKERGSRSRENIADLREGKSLPRLKDRTSYSREIIADLREGKSLPRLK